MAAFMARHRLGEVFPAGNVEALVAALQRSISQRELIVRRIAGDRALLEEYAWERQEIALLGAYDALWRRR